MARHHSAGTRLPRRRISLTAWGDTPTARATATWLFRWWRMAWRRAPISFGFSDGFLGIPVVPVPTRELNKNTCSASTRLLVPREIKPEITRCLVQPPVFLVYTHLS